MEDNNHLSTSGAIVVSGAIIGGLVGGIPGFVIGGLILIVRLHPSCTHSSPKYILCQSFSTKPG